MLAETAPAASHTTIQAEMLWQMKEILRKKGLAYVDFSVRFVSQIPPDPHTGKKQLIVQNREERSVTA